MDACPVQDSKGWQQAAQNSAAVASESTQQHVIASRPAAGRACSGWPKQEDGTQLGTRTCNSTGEKQETGGEIECCFAHGHAEGISHQREHHSHCGSRQLGIDEKEADAIATQAVDTQRYSPAQGECAADQQHIVAPGLLQSQNPCPPAGLEAGKICGQPESEVRRIPEPVHEAQQLQQQRRCRPAQHGKEGNKAGSRECTATQHDPQQQPLEVVDLTAESPTPSPAATGRESRLPPACPAASKPTSSTKQPAISCPSPHRCSRWQLHSRGNMGQPSP